MWRGSLPSCAMPAAMSDPQRGVANAELRDAGAARSTPSAMCYDAPSLGFTSVKWVANSGVLIISR